MSNVQNVWALVLAGGDGSRLRALTTKPCGTAVPKQFCSLSGERSLMEDALARARTLVDDDRVCAIVAHQHRRWWSEIEVLRRLPAKNLIVQPRNRGTAIGILYAVLHILAQDPKATIVLLPADHFVREEGILLESLRLAVARVEKAPDRPVLLGMQPEEIDPDLGYILPGPIDPNGGQGVARFVEKPSLAIARDIVEHGGVWNAFIIAASGRTLIDMFMPRYAPLVMEMRLILGRRFAMEFPAAGWPAIVDLYERLPDLDFSKDILEHRSSDLCMLAVPPCGWSDLGTPHRVGETLQRLKQREPAGTFTRSSVYLNLAAQHAQFERSSRFGASA